MFHDELRTDYIVLCVVCGYNYIETSLSQKQLTPHNDKVCHLANYEVQTNHNPQYFIRAVSESSLSESER